MSAADELVVLFMKFLFTLSPPTHLLYILIDCDVNCHKKCEKLAANLCGVNQKLIVEALASVRKENQGRKFG